MNAAAQDTLETALPEIRIQATRGASAGNEAPLAVAVRAGSAATLGDLPDGLPGLMAADRGHMALGDRILIRGSGARAAFGVRGVHLRLDGMPLTLPDGQSVTEVVEPALIRRTELLRGPASLYWGNGAGGVLALDTGVSPSSEQRSTALLSAGSWGQRRAVVETVQPMGSGAVQAYGSLLRQDGYRDHADGRLLRAGLQHTATLAGGWRARSTFRLVDQDVRHPGSLTLAQAADDYRAADVRYVDQRASKASRQGQLGVEIGRVWARTSFESGAYGLRRALTNALPFAWIDLNRAAGGAWALVRTEQAGFEWTATAEWGLQSDRRKNFGNDAGSRVGDETLDQEERVRLAGAMIAASRQLSPMVRVSAGLRADRMHFDLSDRRLDDGDQSGDRAFSAVSPQLGISLRGAAGWVAFLSYGSGFETPTTTELVNREDGAGGFNASVGAQHLHGLETGVRYRSDRWTFDIAAFAQRTDGLLQPAQNEVGRTFYRNAGRAEGRGLEALVAVHTRSGWTFRTTGALQDYRFRGDRDVAGGTIPGIPTAFGMAVVERQAGAWRMGGRLRARASTFGDDANTLEAPGWVLADASAARRFGPHLEAQIEMLNVFDRDYVGTIIVNARGGRIAEPGNGRALRAGLVLTR